MLCLQPDDVTARAAENPSAVGQKILDDVVAVGLEHHAGAAMLADLLLGPLDHAVALAGVGRFHLALGRDLEALFSARLGLQLGHFALLQVRLWTRQRAGPAGLLNMSVLNGSASPPRQPLLAGRREGRVYGRERPKRQPEQANARETI